MVFTMTLQNHISNSSFVMGQSSIYCQYKRTDITWHFSIHLVVSNEMLPLLNTLLKFGKTSFDIRIHITVLHFLPCIKTILRCFNICIRLILVLLMIIPLFGTLFVDNQTFCILRFIFFISSVCPFQRRHNESKPLFT